MMAVPIIVVRMIVLGISDKYEDSAIEDEMLFKLNCSGIETSKKARMKKFLEQNYKCALQFLV
jgi:hypothetical protein